MASGGTGTYGLPYPLQVDPVDVAADIQSLAVAVDSELVLKAPIESPSFTGNATAQTQNSADNSTRIATTAFVKNQSYLSSSTAASVYAPINSPTFTGTVSAPTPTAGDSSTKVATTAFVSTALSNFVTLPSQSGNENKFLKTDGANASWQTITTSDVSGLSTVINGLSSTYSPLNMAVTTSTAVQRVLSQGDSATLIQMNNSSGNTVSIPLDGTNGYTFPVGTQVVVVQIGTGQTNIAGAASVTVNATPGLKLRARWSAATIIKVAANSWVVFGDVVA